jgi:hypothetical protein
MRFPLRLSIALAIVLGTLASAIAAEEETPFKRSGRVFMPEQGFSMIVQKGWSEQREDKSIILVVPGKGGSKANIIISPWDTPRKPAEFAADAAAQMEPKGYRVGKPEPFVTESKLEGIKLPATAPDGRRVGIQYLLSAGPERMLTLTGTYEPKFNPGFEELLDASVKSLYLLYQPPNLPAELGIRIGDQRATVRIPRGWDPLADLDNVNAFGPPVIDHAQQLFVNFEQSEAPLREYAEAHARATRPKELEFGDLEVFAAPEGGVGLKARGILRPSEGKEVQTATYYFDGPEGTKVIIAASADATAWPTLEGLFDACARSLRITR